jgi:hypothetical protein
VKDQLAQTFYWTAARNLRFSTEISSLVRLLARASIPVLLLKGAYLGEHVYANIGLRSMADVDLLVPRDAIPSAIQIAQQAGFMPDRQFFADADGVLHYHAPPMTKNGLIVELHWGLTRESNLPEINVDDLWARAHRIEVNGVEAWSLSPEDLLLHLAVHASYGHRLFHQLRSLYDMEVVLQKFGKSLDWRVFLVVCRQWQAERGVHLALQLLKDLFASPVPEDVLTALKPSDYTEDVKKAALASLVQETPVLSENFVRLMRSPRLADKLSGLWNGLFPRREIIAMEFDISPHSWRVWKSYPVHVARSISKYWRYAWHLVLGNRDQVGGSDARMALNEYLRVG